MVKPTKQKKPKTKPIKKVKGIHPNSRKAMKTVGAAIRQERINTRKNSKSLKQQTLANKLEWFRDHLEEVSNKPSKEEILHLVETYFKRFDTELEQMSIVHGIKGRKVNQHAARHDVITHQIETEERNFNTCGFELPNLSNEENVKYLRAWQGELNLLPNIKLRTYNRKELS